MPQYFKDSSIKELSSSVGESASRPDSRKLVTTVCLILVELRGGRVREKGKKTRTLFATNLSGFFFHTCVFFLVPQRRLV